MELECDGCKITTDPTTRLRVDGKTVMCDYCWANRDTPRQIAFGLLDAKA